MNPATQPCKSSPITALALKPQREFGASRSPHRTWDLQREGNETPGGGTEPPALCTRWERSTSPVRSAPSSFLYPCPHHGEGRFQVKVIFSFYAEGSSCQAAKLQTHLLKLVPRGIPSPGNAFLLAPPACTLNALPVSPTHQHGALSSSTSPAQAQLQPGHAGAAAADRFEVSHPCHCRTC